MAIANERAFNQLQAQGIRDTTTVAVVEAFGEDLKHFSDEDWVRLIFLVRGLDQCDADKIVHVLSAHNERCIERGHV